MEKKFIEREWNEDIDGELDEEGFFVAPNGSFWDPDYVYFNREGYDKHGGYYDENSNYIPGEGWDEINNVILMMIIIMIMMIIMIIMIKKNIIIIIILMILLINMNMKILMMIF